MVGVGRTKTLHDYKCTLIHTCLYIHSHLLALHQCVQGHRGENSQEHGQHGTWFQFSSGRKERSNNIEITSNSIEITEHCRDI